MVKQGQPGRVPGFRPVGLALCFMPLVDQLNKHLFPATFADVFPPPARISLHNASYKT
jgi:hypothetical protein